MRVPSLSNLHTTDWSQPLRRPTIKDVAREARCSLSTVSLVVNNRGYVKKETRERVLKIVKDLGYHATRSARGLASKTSGNIGFILREDHFTQAEPFYTRVFLGAEFAASAHGFYVLLTTIKQNFRERDEIPRFLLEQNVDGLIIAGKVSVQFLVKAARFGIPIVLVDFEQKKKHWPSVLIDNRGGARTVTKHLIGLGHKNIAFVAGDIEHPSLTERLQGYRDALGEAGVPVRRDLVDSREPDSRIANGATAMARLLQQHPRASAVFAANDALAIGCLREIQREGLSVPADIAVAGFDDIEVSALMHPPLTTIRVFKEDLGRQAIDTLVELIRGRTSTLVTKHVPVELIVRESTAGMVPPEQHKRAQDRTSSLFFSNSHNQEVL
jgi:LacI family transcriptional regulator